MNLTPARFSTLILVSLFSATLVSAQDLAFTSIGMAPEKPAEGPAVEVEGGFMVAYEQRIPGTDITFEMIPVPGGSFLLGSPDDEADRSDDEGPQVKLSVRPMWVAKHEVTWHEYLLYMDMYQIFKDFEAKGERKVDTNDLTDAVTAPTELYDPDHTFEYKTDDSQPAVTMTVYAAKQYSKWLSLMTGLQYRLPTEAEWEYAARAGTETAYSWGDDPEEVEDHSYYFDNAFDGPGLVATKEPNPFGLYDMHGNVAEWTVNEYTEDGYQWLVEAGVTDATKAVKWNTAPWPMVARGGTWEEDPDRLRSAARLPSDDEEWKEEDPNFPKSPWWFSNDPARGVGFRLFRSFEPIPAAELEPFWEAVSEETKMDIEARVSGGRGGYGVVDAELPAAVEAAR
ncbi:MAG: formylglycine-generating enzyme family protein [Planctomycetota bacterium]